jgi:hypothetical protein
MASGDRGVAGRIREFATGLETAGVDLHPGAPGHEPYLRVYLANVDRPVLLNRAADDYQIQRLMVDVLHRVKAPVYFDVDQRDVVKRVLIPRVGRVVKLSKPVGGREWRVYFEGSAARLKVATESDAQRQLAAVLEESHVTGRQVELTFDPDSNQIINVQRSAEAAPAAAPSSVTIGVKAIEQLPATTPAKAAQAFEKLAERSCEPGQPAAGCIPFKFVGDGCWVRAHQMCGLLHTHGVASGKVWIYGDLHIDTRFTSSCAQEWNFHVAAFVRTTEDQVLVYDPSLAAAPLSVDDWMMLMNDTSAQTEFSAAPIYVMAERGNARLELSGEFARERASFVVELLKLNASGPLPFSHCPL